MTMFTGDHLRKIRTFKGIKQTMAAKRLHITQPAYCKLEQSASICEQRWKLVMYALAIPEEEWKQLLHLTPPLNG